MVQKVPFIWKTKIVTHNIDKNEFQEIRAVNLKIKFKKLLEKHGRPFLWFLEVGRDFLKHKRQRKHKVKRQAREQDTISAMQVTEEELKQE